jgi:hypothetical protein
MGDMITLNASGHLLQRWMKPAIRMYELTSSCASVIAVRKPIRRKYRLNPSVFRRNERTRGPLSTMVPTPPQAEQASPGLHFSVHLVKTVALLKASKRLRAQIILTNAC